MRKFALILFLMMPVMVFAQGDDPVVGIEMFSSLTALAAGVLALTSLIKGLFNTNGLITDIVSWGISLPLALLAWKFGWGIFEGLTWYMALIHGILASFLANKGWDLGSVIFGKKDVNYKNK
jgi:hypothetical protein